MSQPARIALVITGLDVGGAEQTLVRLACGLDRRRFTPVVCSLAPQPPATRHVLVKQLERANVPVDFLGIRHPWQFPAAVGRLRHWLAEVQPALVHTWLFHANVVGAVAWGRRDAPLLAGIRVTDRPAWRRWALRCIAPRVDRFVCVSKSVAEYCHRPLRLTPDRTVVVPNGVLLAKYPAAEVADPTEFGIAAGRRMLLVVGRLDAQKGVDWLIEQMPGILSQLPRHDLLVVGDGPQRARLRRRTEQLGLADRVHWAGFRSDVPAIMATADVLLLPSRYEGMANVLLEAMASRLPVVARRAEGVAESLGPLAAEQSTPPDDAPRFAERTIAIASDIALAQRLGQSNRNWVEHEFSVEKMITAYQQLYESQTRLDA